MTNSLSFKKTTLALAVALSLPVISAHATDNYKAQDVVVTASRVEQQLADVNMLLAVKKLNKTPEHRLSVIC